MIYYKDTQFWQGKWTAYGGITGSTPGGAGTVLLQVRSMWQNYWLKSWWCWYCVLTGKENGHHVVELLAQVLVVLVLCSYR